MKYGTWHEIRTLQKALSFSLRFMLPVVIAYFISYVELFGKYDIRFLNIGLFSMIAHYFLMIVQVFLWAGVYNVLAEMVTGSELVMRSTSFSNGIRFWPIAAWVLICPYLIDFVLYIFTGHMVFRVEQLAIVLSPFLSEYVVRHVVRHKYPDRLISVEDLSWLDMLILGGAVLLALGLEQLGEGGVLPSQLVPLVKFSWHAAGAFVLYYVFYAAMRRISDVKDKEHPYDLLLVNPPASGILLGCASLLIRACPMFFVTLRAFTPPGYRIIELNRFLWSKDYAKSGALVAISCYTTNASQAYAMARSFRQGGSKVVMGGPHVSLFPQEALEYCDAVVVGPAEGVWRKVVMDFEHGKMGGIYQGACSEEDLEHVYQYLLKQPPRVAMDTLMVTRGCKFSCYFCTHSKSLNTPPRRVETMVALLEHIKSISNTVAFFDSNFYADPVYAKELMKAMIPLNMRWSSASSLDIAADDEALELLRASGCRSLLIGYEVADSSEESERGGKLSMTKNYLTLSRRLQKKGISIKGHFMFGFPKDSWRNLWKLWKFCFKLFPEQTALAYMTPIPGSQYYNDMARDGRLIDLNWRNYSGYMMVAEHGRLQAQPLLRESFMATVFLMFFITTSRWGNYFLLAVLLGGWLLFR